MRTMIACAVAAAALAACDHDMGARQSVEIEGRTYDVAPGVRYEGQWYASPSDRSLIFDAPAGVHAGNVAAIEAVTGCDVIPQTVGHPDGISTTAEVSCG